MHINGVSLNKPGGPAAIVSGTIISSALGAYIASRRGSHPRGFWYRFRLDKPRWTPPERLFRPVWTVLYAMSAASAIRVARARRDKKRRRALALWTTQHLFNTAWTPLFFGLKKPGLALADLGLLLASTLAYTARARAVDKPAAWLMAPYLGWISFAGLLNAAIVRRSR